MRKIPLHLVKILELCFIASFLPAPAFADDPLELKVRHYEVQGATIIDALRELKSAMPDRELVFTLEVAPFRKEPEHNLTLRFENSSVRQILDAIKSAGPRYGCEIVDSAVVHFFPLSLKHDAEDLLNVGVKSTKLSGVAFDVVLKYPPYFIPELGTEMRRRSGAQGSTIVMMGSDVPQITVAVSDGTVRDVLNRVALETLKFREGRHGATGWVYTFRIDESLPLGGEPRWELL